MSLFDIINKVKKEVEKLASEVINGDKPAENPEETKPCESSCAQPQQEEWGEGDTWYDHIPAEECQYNSGTTYLEYFEKIFREDFPEYDITREDAEPFRRYVYTFAKEGAVKLVVELMSERSSVRKTRNECLKSGIPYLRFYFDHSGWWNTRSYVKDRIRAAL